jgi:hypothetical protein
LPRTPVPHLATGHTGADPRRAVCVAFRGASAAERTRQATPQVHSADGDGLRATVDLGSDRRHQQTGGEHRQSNPTPHLCIQHVSAPLVKKQLSKFARIDHHDQPAIPVHTSRQYNLHNRNTRSFGVDIMTVAFLRLESIDTLRSTLRGGFPPIGVADVLQLLKRGGKSRTSLACHPANDSCRACILSRDSELH